MMNREPGNRGSANQPPHFAGAAGIAGRSREQQRMAVPSQAPVYSNWFETYAGAEPHDVLVAMHQKTLEGPDKEISFEDWKSRVARDMRERCPDVDLPLGNTPDEEGRFVAGLVSIGVLNQRT